MLDTMPDGNDIELRLILSSELTGEYAALSHCWGSHETAKTTSKDIDSRLRNIPFESLPKTSQDAINLCREFKIRYIWIDSLCIIQDNEAAWRHEANGMTMVYGNAFLVLVASASSGDEISMFPRRQDRYCHTIDLE